MDAHPEAYAEFYFGETKAINIILVGRSRTGKSSSLGAMINPLFRKPHTSFSETREPQYHSMMLYDGTHKQMYQVNIIDTPGLGEHSFNSSHDRTNVKQLELMKKSIEQKITAINCICFVSEAGRTAQHDMILFDALVDFFGPECAQNSMMILTHCDKFNKDRLEVIHTNIQQHPDTRRAFEYCQLGIFNHGILGFDVLDMLDDMSEDIVQRYIASQTQRIAPMRKRLIEGFISTVDSAKPVSELQQMSAAYERKKEILIREIMDDLLCVTGGENSTG